MSCIQAAKTTSDIIRTCLGPQAMLKMILDGMGTLVITNDGNSILREIDVGHPAAKAVVELARAQDEEVGDGTTSVVVLTGEILARVEPLLVEGVHPGVIVAGLQKAVKDALEHLQLVKKPVDGSNDDVVIKIIQTAIGTKFLSRYSGFLANLALKAVRLIGAADGRVNLKKALRIERIPGGELEESYVMQGVMIEKDVLHSAMSRRIENPKVLILDCGLEYRKGESQTAVEVTGTGDYAAVLEEEEEQVRQMCRAVIATGCNVVCCEKGVCDLALHYLSEANITALRRFQKVQLDRIAGVTGATVVSDPVDFIASDLGTQCKLYECRKFQDEWWSCFDNCESPRACTMVLRGPTKDVLLEMYRVLDDALKVAKNIVKEPALVPGGGATEISVVAALRKKGQAISSVDRDAYMAAASAFEVIPRTLVQNCGANPVRAITELRAIHAAGGLAKASVGIDGMTGKIADVETTGIWDSLAVKEQVYKTAFECAIALVRVDDIVSGVVKRDEQGNPVNQKSVKEKLEENAAMQAAGEGA